MSQAQTSFPPRTAAYSRLPDRTAPAPQQPNPQQNFGQSAPAFARRPEVQQNPYASYSYGPQQGQQQQQPLVGQPDFRSNTVKESNTLHELQDEQREEINEAFGLFDLDHDRFLDYHELRVALRALGFQPPKHEILQIMSANGQPKRNAQPLNSGRGQPEYHPSQMLIGQNAFVRVAAQKMMDRDPREEIERAFHLFSGGQKDIIDLDDLRRVTRELGETSLDEQELQNMIEEFDIDGRGGVSLASFQSICMQGP